MLVQDHGNIRKAFMRLKRGFYSGVKKDTTFVNMMLSNINKLCLIYSRNKKNTIIHNFGLWRQSSIESKIKEEELLISQVKQTIEEMLPSIIPKQPLEEYKQTWRTDIELSFGKLI